MRWRFRRSTFLRDLAVKPLAMWVSRALDEQRRAVHTQHVCI